MLEATKLLNVRQTIVVIYKIRRELLPNHLMEEINLVENKHLRD